MCVPSSSIKEMSWPFPKCCFCLVFPPPQTFAVLNGFDDLFFIVLQISSFIFRRIALHILEYSMLSVGVPFLFICLRFSLSLFGTCWQLTGFVTFVSASYWNGSFMNHLCSYITPRVKIIIRFYFFNLLSSSYFLQRTLYRNELLL